MSRSCSICAQPGVDQINALVRAHKPLREVARDFGIARATLARHAGHVEAGHPTDSGPPPGGHLASAAELIAAVKVIRGADFSAQDAAEAQQLRSLAEAVDASPTNIAALRELRITLDGFRRGALKADPSDQLELAALVAKLTGRRDGTYERTFAAVIAAGGDEGVAQAAAEAAVLA